MLRRLLPPTSTFATRRSGVRASGRPPHTFSSLSLAAPGGKRAEFASQPKLTGQVTAIAASNCDLLLLQRRLPMEDELPTTVSLDQRPRRSQATLTVRRGRNGGHQCDVLNLLDIHVRPRGATRQSSEPVLFRVNGA